MTLLADNCDEDTWLGEKIVAQVKQAVVNRHSITARSVVRKLKWEPTQRNYVQAGMILRRLGWRPVEGRIGNGKRRQWVRDKEVEMK